VYGRVDRKWKKHAKLYWVHWLFCSFILLLFFKMTWSWNKKNPRIKLQLMPYYLNSFIEMK
jgi:hypothetical protein